MRFKCLISCCLLLLCLGGCSKEVEEEVVEFVEETPPLSEVADSATFEDLTVDALGPWCGFIYNATSLEIHPFYDSTQHIIIERILLSDKPYWKVIKSTEGVIVKEYPHGSMLTMSSGASYGYIEDGNGYAYVLSTDTLPSSYLDYIMRNVGGLDMEGD